MRAGRTLGYLEKVVWLLAGVCLLGGVALGLSDYSQQEQRLAAFQADVSAFRTGLPDLSDWSPGRRDAWARAVAAGSPGAAAVLRIPALRIEAEIYDNTSDRALDLGVGRIEGTAAPGMAGNAGIAGHRDGHFRRLKDVRPGQVIEILTREARIAYRVESTRIVAPTATEVLQDDGTAVLTLVTCYPFYFLGSAPDRFIVRATLISSDDTFTQLSKRK